MRRRFIVAIAAVAMLLAAAPSQARPVAFRHGTLDDRFSTSKPGAPSGFTYRGSYHAAGNPKAPPPYMRRMTFYAARGVRYDTGAAPRCKASDTELAIRGPSACPPGSRLGGGTTVGVFMGEFPSTLKADFFNAPRQQIILVRSPVFASVSRGHIANDMSVTYESPTCYPYLLPAPCPIDNALQVSTVMKVARAGTGSRTVMRTPRTCPRSGRWTGAIRFWWKDGTTDLVHTRQRCS